VVVFWTKNPEPIIPYLPELDKRGIHYYFQVTLNDYVQEGFEPNVPPVAKRIDTFKKLVDTLGEGHVIWRFDPLILTKDIDIDSLLSKIEHIGDQLKGYTEKMVFSFADILSYKKVKGNLEKNHIVYVDWTEPQMQEFAKKLSELNKKWGYTLATCGEKIDLKEFGIAHNHCIDYDLIVRFAH
jgi:DNA repair photolyase